MIRPGVDLQLLDLRARKPVPGEHPLDGFAQHLRRPPRELVLERPRAEAARVARVPVVHLVLELVPGDRDLLGVHDDDEVARVHVRRVLGLRLAAERVRDLRSQTPQRLSFGVDEVPAALDLARLCVPGLHRKRRDWSPPAANRSSPARNSVAPPWLGWRTYGASSTACATRPTAMTVRPRARSWRNGREASTSVLVGGRFVSGRAGR